MSRAFLRVTHSILPVRTEKYFDTSISVGHLKEKLHIVVGTSPSNMRLQLRTEDGDVVGFMDNDTAPLSAFGVRDQMEIHVLDIDPETVMQWTDVSRVEKVTMSDADYDKREDSFRKFRQQFLEQKGPSDGDTEHDVSMAGVRAPASSVTFNLEDRCEVNHEEMKKRGTIKFVGTVDFQTGIWVGVQLDEPVGKNDGTVRGRRYFECPLGYGIFVKPDRVIVGEFPEESYVDDEL